MSSINIYVLKKYYKPDRFFTKEANVYGNEACSLATLYLGIDATKRTPESLAIPNIIVLIKQQTRDINQLFMLSGPSHFMLKFL